MGPIDFNRLSTQAVRPRTDSILDPRDLFSALPEKVPELDYLRGPQDQVLNTWHGRRAERDLVIKMNTGGGKTAVGLLIAKSLLNEGTFPVAYLTPDDFLKGQVIKEAKRLGLATTTEPRDPDCQQGRAILVDTFASLFNARSVFGVEGSVRKSPSCQLASIIVDDAHSCIAQADQKFRLTIPQGSYAYTALLDLFADDLQQQSLAGLLDLRTRRTDAMMEVPFWAWQSKQESVLEILHPLADSVLEWSWPLVVDSLPLCTAVIATDSVDIQPPCYPTGVIRGFADARRRIYLTATLADDSVLVRHFGAARDAVEKPIVPANAGDIGDRMILVPQQLYPQLADTTLRDFIVDRSKERNVVVIVPSARRAKWWEDDAALVLDKDSITEGVEALRANPRLGLAVFINRYDGVDLPGDACNLLVLDGLPEAVDGTERLEQVQMGDSASVLARQIQRLEQGMGRATRSNNDHAVVLLLGSRLSERLNNRAARALFSPATRVQLDMATQIANQLDPKTLDDLVDVMNQCLGRDEGWIGFSKGQLAEVRYESPSVGAAAEQERKAFESALSGSYTDAAQLEGAASGEAADDAAKGLRRQRRATYTNFYDPAEAQSLQKSANRLNRRLLRPLEGVTYERLSGQNRPQAEQASSWLQSHYDSGNKLLLGFKALHDDLVWGPDYRRFEQALCDLAWHIGLAGQRPEVTVGRGPDDLWAFRDGSFFVIEAKSGADSGHAVSKDDAKQLSNAMDWFAEQYPASTGTPILVHPDPRFEFHAAVPTGCRVVTLDRLEKLRTALMKLATGLSANSAYRNPKQVASLLESNGFTRHGFIERFTVPGRQEKGQ